LYNNGTPNAVSNYGDIKTGVRSATLNTYYALGYLDFGHVAYARPHYVIIVVRV